MCSLVKYAIISFKFELSRLPEAKIFLELRVEQLKAYLAEDSGAGGLGSDDELHVAIASCYQRMGRYKQALNHVGQALVAGRAGSEDKQVKWLHHVLLRQNGIEERKMELKEKLQEIKVNALLHMPTPLQVCLWYVYLARGTLYKATVMAVSNSF